MGDEGSGGNEGEAERGFVGPQPHEEGVRTGHEKRDTTKARENGTRDRE